MRRPSLLCFVGLQFRFASLLCALPSQPSDSEPSCGQVRSRRRCAGPSRLHRLRPAEELEKRGDELRAEKSFFDALDYYQAALAKKTNNPQIFQ